MESYFYKVTITFFGLRYELLCVYFLTLVNKREFTGEWSEIEVVKKREFTGAWSEIEVVKKS